MHYKIIGASKKFKNQLHPLLRPLRLEIYRKVLKVPKTTKNKKNCVVTSGHKDDIYIYFLGLPHKIFFLKNMMIMAKVSAGTQFVHIQSA